MIELRPLASPLSRTLAKYTVLLAFLIGLCLSSLQVLDDYQHQDSLIEQTLNQLLMLSEPPAARAVNTLDASLAEEVVNGLLKYPFIEQASIIDDFGKTLAHSKQDYVASVTRWLTETITQESKLYRIPLFGPTYSKANPGELRLQVNMDQALQPFFERAGRILLLGVARNLLLALALLILFYSVLTRPLQRLSRQFADYRSESNDSPRLHIDPRHAGNELGLLCNAGNRFIETVEQLLLDNEQGQRDLSDSEARLHKLIDRVPQLILAVNNAGSILFANQQLAQFYAVKPEQLCGNSLRKLHRYAPLELRQLDEVARLCRQESKPRKIQELPWSRHDGRQHILSLQIAPFEYFSEPAMLIVASDITEQTRMQRQVSHLSSHDSLTGLPNRILFGDRLQQTLADAIREQRFGALLFVDLDNFMTLNDSLGHELGDRLLKRIAQLLRSAVPEHDTVARLGGDEFVILLKRDETSQASIEATTKQLSTLLLKKIATPQTLDEHSIRISASMGAVVFPFKESSAEDLIRYADTALYQAKNAGRNCCIFYSAEMSVGIERRQRLENELYTALLRGEFLLHYQPQVDNLGNIFGFEALMRWQHPRRGLVPPSEFIPILESSGLIIEVGNWLSRSCCEQIRHWRESGYWQDNWHLAINISPHQFYQADFVANLETEILRAEIRFQDLCVEVTESVMIDDIDTVIGRLEALRSLGIMVALDDFGTGFSSLSYLRMLPIDLLKIDRAFVIELGLQAKNQAIVQAVILMAKALGLQVIAEGVETLEQRDICLASGCNYFQGYLYARPSPVDELLNAYPLETGSGTTLQ